MWFVNTKKHQEDLKKKLLRHWQQNFTIKELYGGIKMDAKELAEDIYNNLLYGECLYNKNMYESLKKDIIDLLCEIEHEFKENTKEM